MAVKPPWLAIPITLHALMVRAGLDAATRDLNVEAWSFVALHQTDGKLTEVEARRLYSSSPKHRSLLLERGFWRTEQGGYEVIGYLDLNSTKAEIEEARAEHRAKVSSFRARRKSEGVEPTE